VKLIHTPRFLGFIGYDAMVIYPFLLHREKQPSRILVNHERIHFAQIKRDGFIYFYVRYVVEYLINRFRWMGHDLAYINISYEVEAYMNQGDFDYEVS
jgi:hypothetical protein